MAASNINAENIPAKYPDDFLSSHIDHKTIKTDTTVIDIGMKLGVRCGSIVIVIMYYSTIGP